jgi:hypothetical protein
MRKLQVLAALTAAAAMPLSAATYTHGQPGLWQATAQLDFAKGGPPPMPPDVVARMKQMGRNMPNMSGPMTSQFCLTPERAAEDKPPTPPQHGDCKMQNFKRDGHSFTADMVCSGHMQGSGHMTVSYDSDQHYAGSMHFTGTGPMGEVDMTNTFSGQWLGADCGSTPALPDK